MMAEYAQRDPEIVSKNMARIRRSGSKMERALASEMWQLGLRYRKQYAIHGRPDFAFVRARVAVFCDSHFWHGYEWEPMGKAAIRKNRAFWVAKIERNISRDREVERELIRLGWTVLRFWEHEIRSSPEQCAKIVEHNVGSRS